MTNGACPLFLVDIVQGKYDTCSPSMHDQPSGWLIRQPFDILLTETIWLTCTSSTDHISWNERDLH